MELFDDEAIENLQRMAQINARNRLIAMKNAAIEAEKRKPQCPHCGGRLPGRFSYCANCNRELFWGHSATRDPFTTFGEAQYNISQVTKGIKEKQAAELRAKEEAQAKLEQHGLLVLGVGLSFPIIVCGVLVYAVYLLAQYFYFPENEYIDRLWLTGAVAGFATTAKVGLSFHPFVVMMALAVQAFAMASYSLPVSIWAITGVSGLAELLPQRNVKQFNVPLKMITWSILLLVPIYLMYRDFISPYETTLTANPGLASQSSVGTYQSEEASSMRVPNQNTSSSFVDRTHQQELAVLSRLKADYDSAMEAWNMQEVKRTELADELKKTKYEIERLHLKKPQPPEKPQEREWISANGKHKTIATLISSDFKNATLRKNDGKMIEVDKKSLSIPDILIIENFFVEEKYYRTALEKWDVQFHELQSIQAAKQSQLDEHQGLSKSKPKEPTIDDAKIELGIRQ
jgi:hypothetical protein